MDAGTKGGREGRREGGREEGRDEGTKGGREGGKEEGRAVGGEAGRGAGRVGRGQYEAGGRQGSWRRGGQRRGEVDRVRSSAREGGGRETFIRRSYSTAACFRSTLCSAFRLVTCRRGDSLMTEPTPPQDRHGALYVSRDSPNVKYPRSKVVLLKQPVEISRDCW